MRSSPVPVLLLLAAVASAQVTGEPYATRMGLTGNPGLTNPALRAELLPRLEQQRRARTDFMASARDDLSGLVVLGAQARSLLAAVPPNPPDDELLLRTLEEASATISLLQLFQLHALAGGLADDIRGVYLTLESTYPWNPVLRALRQGADARRAAMRLN